MAGYHEKRAAKFAAAVEKNRSARNTDRPTAGTSAQYRAGQIEPLGFTGTRRHGNKRGADTKGNAEWRTVSQNDKTGRFDANLSLTRSDLNL